MTEGINSIKFNSAAAQQANVKAETKSKEESKDTEIKKQEATPNKVSEKTLATVDKAWTSYAIAGMNIKTSKDANVNKTAEYYLSKLSPELRAQLEAEIGALMEQFEPGVVNWFKHFEEELGANFKNLPQDEQLALAATAFVNNEDE